MSRAHRTMTGAAVRNHRCHHHHRRRLSLSPLLLLLLLLAVVASGAASLPTSRQHGHTSSSALRKLRLRPSATFRGRGTGTWAPATATRRDTRCHGTVNPGDLVLVTGSTGGVGQLVVANLLSKGYRVRAVTRSAEKGRELFGDAENLEVVVADQRFANSIDPHLEGVDGIVSCSGTTAFPSKRWDGDNGPEMTDKVGLHNLIEGAKKRKEKIKRFFLVSSTGVVRRKQFPFAIMNAFGVLDFKKLSEEYLEQSGLPYTIFRPGRLTDGPYTSYDLNTLLKATSGNRKNIEFSKEDNLNGEMSRVTLAEAIAQGIQLPQTENAILSMMSREGDGPGDEAARWDQLYQEILAK